MDAGELPLTEVIQELRVELARSMRAADGQDLRFELGPVELELQVTASREVTADGGIRFYVVSAGAKGTETEQHVHTVKLTLTPHLASAPGAAVDVGTGGDLGG